MRDNRALQRETRSFTDNSHVISNHSSDGDKNVTNWLSFARVIFIGAQFTSVLVISTTGNVLFCIYWTTCAHDDKFSNFSCYLWYQVNSRINRTHFSCLMTYWIVENLLQTCKLTFQMMFALSSTSSLLKFPIKELKHETFFDGKTLVLTSVTCGLWRKTSLFVSKSHPVGCRSWLKNVSCFKLPINWRRRRGQSV